MSYRLLLFKKVNLFLKKLDNINKERVEKKLRELKINPRLGKPLIGKLSGLWSLRIGDYRALYRIKQDALEVWVIKLGHRKNIYD